MQTVEYK